MFPGPAAIARRARFPQAYNDQRSSEGEIAVSRMSIRNLEWPCAEVVESIVPEI
jgi:hypothetical protein